MSNELQLPQEWDWQNVKAALEEWAYQIAAGQRFCPAGAMCEFGGSVAPDGWVVCDGTEYEQTKYPELYKAIGQFFGGNPGTFMVPNSVAVKGQIWIIKV